jgi:hypothetical protein
MSSEQRTPGVNVTVGCAVQKQGCVGCIFGVHELLGSNLHVSTAACLRISFVQRRARIFPRGLLPLGVRQFVGMRLLYSLNCTNGGQRDTDLFSDECFRPPMPWCIKAVHFTTLGRYAGARLRQTPN